MSAAAPDPALRRTLLVARRKREQRGFEGDGIVVTPELEPPEALALDGLLSPRHPVLPGQSRRIRLSVLESALRACGIDPLRAYDAVGEGPLRDMPAEHAAARRARDDLRAWLLNHDVVRRHPRLAPWLGEAARQGRVRDDTRPLVEQALRIVGALPARPTVQRCVLAAELLGGDPHGLDPDTPLHRLTVTLLGAAAGLAESAPAREIWAAWDVLVDPISSSVAALNLPPPADDRLARMLELMRGKHVVFTYGQLEAADLRWPRGTECFTCENPSVLVAVERDLGNRSPPLICTGGRPSDAVRIVLSSLHASGARIRHHGDFDAAGVQIFRDLEARYAATGWRYDVGSMLDGLRRLGREVPDQAAATLEAAVDAGAHGPAEELLLDELVDDLSRHALIGA